MDTLKHFQTKHLFFFGKRLFGRALVWRILALGLCAACSAKQGEGLFLLPELAPRPRFSWDYKGVPLVHSDLPEEKSKAPFAKIPVEAGLPGLYETPQGLCIYSQPRAWFLRERGLRLRFCSEELGHELQILYSLVFKRRESEPTNPSYSGRSLDVFYTRLVAWRQSLREPQILIDGGDTPNTSLIRLLPEGFGNLKWQAAYLPQARKPGAYWIGRRFVRASFSLLLDRDSVQLVYPSRIHKGEALILRFKERSFLEATKAALESLRQILAQDQARQGEASDLQVTEYYTGNLDESYLILRNNAEAGLFPVRIDFGNGEFLKTNIFLLSKTQFFLGKENFSNFRLLPSFQVQGRPFAVPSTRGRAVLWKDRRQGFFSAAHCLQNYRGICGRAGLEEGLLALLESRLGEESCRTEDLQLSELNPAGLKSGTAILSDGKFLEFEILRSCRADALDIAFGGHRVALGMESLSRGARLLLTPNPAYFQKGEKAIFLKNREFRYLNKNQEVLIEDLYRNKSRKVYAKPPSLEILDQWGPNAPLYSLRPGPVLQHSRTESCGLRPDLLVQNRMSPGCDASPAFSQRLPYLSEILPAGARDDSGQSLPGEEFIEFAFRSRPEGAAPEASFLLEIADAKGNPTQRILLPPMPRGIAYQSLGRKQSFCFGDGSVRGLVPKLRLPDFGLSLLLKDAAGNTIDSVHIPAWQAKNFRSSVRKSLQRVSADFSAWLFSAPPVQGENCNLYSLASPASTGSWKAAFHLSGPYQLFAKKNDSSSILPEDFRSLRATFLGKEPASIHAEWLSEDARLVKTFDFLLNFKQALDFRAENRRGRELVLLSNNSDAGLPLAAIELWNKSPELIFQSIAPSPASGEQEWIRICSEGGLGLANTESLYLRDQSSSDRIVPWNNRGLPLPAGLSGLRGDSLELPAGKCALLLDPDTRVWNFSVLPRDLLVWTIETGSALGNGLSSAEPLFIEGRQGAKTRVLASYGLPDAPANLQFGLPTQRGECVERRPQSLRDRKENYEVEQCK